MRRLRRDSSERGAVGGAEVIPFALMTFVGATLLLANAWAVVDAKMATAAAAREAVRYYVETDGDSGGAENIGAETFAAYGHREDVTVSVSGAFQRCGRVTARASTSVPIINVPLLGGYGRAFHVTSTQSAIVDPFRSNPGITGVCGVPA